MIIERLVNRLEAWQHELDVSRVSELFIRVIYLVLFWNFMRLVPISEIVWGTEHFLVLNNPYQGIDQLSMILHEEQVRAFYGWFLYPFIGLVLAGALGFHHFITRTIAWLLFVVLDFGNPELSTGGHHLMQQLLFFHIFLVKVPKNGEKYHHLAGRLVHHLAFYSIWVQIALLYAVAAYWKFRGELWLNGEAMLMTLSHKEFGFEWLSRSLTENTWWLTIGTYLSFAYQLFFPLLIWVKPIRKWLLLAGLFFHLSIAFIVGITDFGIFMVASYAIFVSKEDAKKMLSRASRSS